MGATARPPRLAIMFTTDLKKCPVCGCPVRMARREDGAADHYEAIGFDPLQDMAEPAPPSLLGFLRASRQNKRTVAIVGSAWTTRAWAPYGERDIEVWCMNEMHGLFGVGAATAWFQLHPRWDFTKEHRFDHWGWLQMEHDHPIYMQRHYEDVPTSTHYPLRDIQADLLGRIYKGEMAIDKIFGCTMSYAVALAVHQRRFDRLELFGIELSLDGEWSYQRESMAFWLGKAAGMGMEIWMPEQCGLFKMPLYAYEEIRKGDGSILVPPKNAESFDGGGVS